MESVFRTSVRYPLGVAKGDEPELQCHSTSRAYVAEVGGQLVHGFTIEKPGKTYVGRNAVFIYHTIVRRPDGRLVDPNFVEGKTKPFIEDPGRPYDYERDIGWNTLIVANIHFRCPVSGQAIPSWQPVWSARVSGVTAFSLKPEHARKRHFGATEGAFAYVESLGLDPSDPIDLCFATNLEMVSVEVEDGSPPPDILKDYKLHRGVMKSVPLVRPLSPSAVLSEDEERALRQRR